MVSDDEFKRVIVDLHEYLLPKHIALDLGVTGAMIEQWRNGENLPQGSTRDSIFKKMQENPI